jgi:TRAP-type C4-dicarboxylate transport system permease large subunit
MLVTLMLVTLLVMILLGVPIAVALAGSSLFFLVVGNLTGEVTTPAITVIHRMVNGVDSFPLLAVPFFIMAGNLMNSAGITKQIYDFAVAAVGWLKGGLGPRERGGLGDLRGHVGHGGRRCRGARHHRDQGHARPWLRHEVRGRPHGGVLHHRSDHSALAAAGDLRRRRKRLDQRPLRRRHRAGAHHGGVPVGRRVALRPPQRRRARCELPLGRLGWSFLNAFLPLLTPAIIIGGMSFGLFTPTEAAVFACAYALLLSLVVHRVFNWILLARGRPMGYSVLTMRQLVRVTMDTIETTAVVLLIVAGASIFGWILTTTRTTDALGAWILEFAADPVTFLILVNVFLLLVGCFMETIAAITILTPVLLPVAVKLGIDPVHFGLIMVLNLMIGLLTPPVGMVLYVLARVSKLSFEETVRAVAPWLVPLLLVLALITFVPETVLWLPRTLKELGYL